ncbi:hypothetical protein M011DRAFT_494261 [Sporormia fimetaria CBS 119925]|uniref:DNA ligase D 3'-phosphoesterase domain-containing protein n=1 Tax=Sporormia fimetaria CBS 119925 TaxID=1340428 RepID=A0A6A6VE59_9PLEO|nr:hypothetical protein M011DRAFT_494261 [Sporormia fimetaria CBS 119925]
MTKTQHPLSVANRMQFEDAGRVKNEDTLTFFTRRLLNVCRPTDPGIPRLSIDQFAELYASNNQEHGHHFVIHQHRSTRGGTHYDLRLQFSATSSISFVIPRGVPGNTSGRRIGRAAVESRVHNLWQHLLESANNMSGSLLIWDTGTYSVLPRSTYSEEKIRKGLGPPRHLYPGMHIKDYPSQHQNERLIHAFQTGLIRLRLHGTRLPKDYTITLKINLGNSPKLSKTNVSSRSETEETHTTGAESEIEALYETRLRLNNAYPGSRNSIGSIFKRRWTLALDRVSSGFVRVSDNNVDEWVRDGDKGFDPFLVGGPGVDRSLVTGRLATEVESDAGLMAHKSQAEDGA